MKNHWLDRKKMRNEPPIIVSWGPPPVIGCTVTVTCPTYSNLISMPTGTAGILPTITICQETNESKINERCFGENPIPSIVSFQPIEGYAGEKFDIGTCPVFGEVVECFAAGAGGVPRQVSVC